MESPQGLDSLAVLQARRHNSDHASFRLGCTHRKVGSASDSSFDAMESETLEAIERDILTRGQTGSPFPLAPSLAPETGGQVGWVRKERTARRICV